MEHTHKSTHILCTETASDCHFELETIPAGMTSCNENRQVNYLVFCQTGSIRITSTLFHDEILGAGEVMFVPRESECSGTALSDTTLLVHTFNNTVCSSEKCILSYLYSHRHIGTKNFCCKLTACPPLQVLTENILSYLAQGTGEFALWQIKHKEMIWLFTRHYPAEELRSFFHPMTDESVPFKSLVMTHYRKANYTEELAKLCGYGVHTFRRLFKKEFGESVYQWLIQRRSEHIKYRLSMPYIPLADIIDEFNFSSPQQFNSFCKQYLRNTPGNIRKAAQQESDEVEQ